VNIHSSNLDFESVEHTNYGNFEGVENEFESLFLFILLIGIIGKIMVFVR